MYSRMTPSPSSRPTWTATATPRRPRRVTALRGPPHPHRQDAPGQRERGRTPLPRGHHRRRGHPPADRAPFKVACSGESAPPGSPPGVPGPRLATNVTSPQSTALDRGAPLTSPQSTALDLAPRFERRKKKSIPASRFNLPTRHPALGHKISRPLAYVDIFVNNWAAQIRETAPRRASRCVEAQGDASRGCCDRVLESFVVAIVASGGAEIEFSGVWP